MTTDSTLGREPVTLFGLKQPRCALAFGQGLCTATGTPCYNTFTTCGDTENYDGSASIEWLFCMSDATAVDYGDFSDPDNIRTNAIPCLKSVSASESKINLGSALKKENPLGVTGSISAGFTDIPWNDHVGDPYLTDRDHYTAGRVLLDIGTFWRLFMARNDFTAGMECFRYQGYEGQAIGDMRKSTHIVDSIDGPSANGSVSIKGIDPLRLDGTFPPVSDIELVAAITDEQTDNILIKGTEADLSATIGNGTRKYFTLGDEVFSYVGYTVNADGHFLLSGVDRGLFGTDQDEHEKGDTLQRAGEYANMIPWYILHDLYTNYTDMPDEYIDLSVLDAEGGTYLPTSRMSHIIFEPTKTREVAAEIVQQGGFSIFWEEYDALIKMVVLRPPESPVITLTDDEHILDGSNVVSDPDSRYTRIHVRWHPHNRLELGDVTDYARGYLNIDNDTETATGEVRELIILSPWIQKRTQAVQLATRLLARYKKTPKFLTLNVDAKDRDATRVGNVVDVDTRYFTDSQGQKIVRRWQVISQKEATPGHVYAIRLQTFDEQGRVAYYAPDGAPTYDTATDEQKEAMAFYADASGLVGGDEGYGYQ